MGKSNRSANAFNQVPGKDERAGLQAKVMKVWSQLTRACATQMDRGLVVDTFYFGTFMKGSSVKESQQGYVYCPGPKSAFKLIENDENILELP